MAPKVLDSQVCAGGVGQLITAPVRLCGVGKCCVGGWGMAPGRYHYKYLIDNTWAVDGLAPKVLDSEVC